jgi:hypothetical protein
VRTQNVQEAKEKLLTLDLEVTLQYANVNLCVLTLKIDHSLQKYSRYMGLYRTFQYGLKGSSAIQYLIWLVKLCYVVQSCLTRMRIDLCCILRSPDPPVRSNPAHRRYFGGGSLQQPGIQPRGRKYTLLPRSIEPQECS